MLSPSPESVLPVRGGFSAVSDDYTTTLSLYGERVEVLQDADPIAAVIAAEAECRRRADGRSRPGVEASRAVVAELRRLAL